MCGVKQRKFPERLDIFDYVTISDDIVDIISARKVINNEKYWGEA